MNWCKEDIGKAINDSKTKSLIFLVYAFDSNSNEMTQLWNNENVFKICNDKCISLSLNADSETCNQFKEIYQIKSFPTTYFIGNNGQVLEVLTGIVSEEELIARIHKAIELHESSKKLTSSGITKGATTSAEASSNKEEPQKTLDERVAIAKEKVRLIQEKKKQEEEEKEKNSEVERRKMGQEILKSKREREEQELKRIADEKKKEKLDDQLAKQKIMDRIQQDREDKQKKYAKEKEELEKQKDAEKIKQEQLRQQQKLAEAAKNSEIARIQFRFIDGSTVVKQFDPNQKLEDARDFVAEKLSEMNEPVSFSMHSSFPKREYTSNDMSLTLRDLQLAPTATILIIPIKSQISKKLGNLLPNTSRSSSSVGSSSSLMTYVYDFVLLLFLPFTIIWGIITGLIGVGNSQSANNPSRDTNVRNNSNSRSENLRQSENLRIRRIGDNSSRDDDENATWNGNSTQQM